MQTLGGLRCHWASGWAVWVPQHPTEHPLILLPPSQATEAAKERSEGRERLFPPLLPLPANTEPLSPFPGQAQPWPALPALLGPQHFGQSFRTNSKPSLQIRHLHQLSSAHVLTTLLPSAPQHIHLQANNLKGDLGNGIRATLRPKPGATKLHACGHNQTMKPSALEIIPMVLIPHSYHLFQQPHCPASSFLQVCQ